MFIVLKRIHIIGLLIGITALFCGLGYLGNMTPVSTTPVENTDTFIIDAGHGGMDGGAVGTSGVMEKDINLNVAMELKNVLESKGKKVILTRDSDKSLHTTDSAKIRAQKRSDLENRKKILTENPGAVFVSVHMNKFEQSKYRGSQVFYADNEKSREIGENVQASLREGLADGNDRVAKTVDSSVFVLKGVTTPAIIVECGFLSNPDEEKLLSQPDYQKKLAVCIADGLLK